MSLDGRMEIHTNLDNIKFFFFLLGKRYIGAMKVSLLSLLYFKVDYGKSIFTSRKCYH